MTATRCKAARHDNKERRRSNKVQEWRLRSATELQIFSAGSMTCVVHDGLSWEQ